MLVQRIDNQRVIGFSDLTTFEKLSNLKPKIVKIWIFKRLKNKVMEQLILTHQKELLAYSFFLTKNKSDAEDLLQDAFIRIFAKEEPISTIKNIKSYLIATLRNMYVDNVRKQKLKAKYQNWITLNQSDLTSNNSEVNMNCQDIYAKIGEIRIEWREPFLLHYQGFSYDEMVQKTGLNVETLRMRVFYARRELMQKLKKTGVS
jgi:RNA polymerase sigma-70 factor, ECF subfamily